MWVVMLPGEYPETSEIYGFFRKEENARAVADRWTRDHPEDPAHVLPILPREAMR